MRHYAGEVTYDASEFLDANRDVVPDDLVAVFDTRACEFGFATHLFGTELKVMSSSSFIFVSFYIIIAKFNDTFD